MKKFEYEIRRTKEFVTKINGADAWVFTQMNLAGEEGWELICPPVEFQEPSQLSNAEGNPIPYYGIVMFLKREVESSAI